MKIVSSLREIPTLLPPISFAIGTFDGVHRGHLTLFEELKKWGTPTLLTFKDHPALTLGKKEPLSLTPLEEKLHLLEQAGIALTILLPFTKELASQSYVDFLSDIRKHLPFSTLVVGENDGFGKAREGSGERLTLMGKNAGFNVVFVKKLSLEGEEISSSKIRSYLSQGNLEYASYLTGRNLKKGSYE